MPTFPDTAGPRVYALLLDAPNLAIDDALIEVLPQLDADERLWAVETLLARGQERGMLALVAAFSGLDEVLQEQIITRSDRLFTGARLAVTDKSAEVRLSAIKFIQRVDDPRLSYLLAEALRIACPKTRAAAAAGLQLMARRFIERRTTLALNSEAGADLLRDGNNLAQALERAIDCWDLHFRFEVLTAAMYLSDLLEDVLLTKASSARSRFRRAILEVLANPQDPGLAGFALRALQSRELRVAVAKQIGSCTHMEFLKGLMAESWLLSDPRIGHEMARIRQWAWLTADPDALLSLTDSEAVGAIRLIAASGMTPNAKVAVYQRMLVSGPDLVKPVVFDRLCSLETEQATSLLRALTQRKGTQLANMAERELRGRTAWQQNHSAAIPHAEAQQQQHPFEVYLNSFDQLSEQDQLARGQALQRNCDNLTQLIQAKLLLADVAGRGQLLKIVRLLGLAGAMSENLFKLAGDPEPLNRSQAVALMAELDGPTARRVVRRALYDPDARVQSNAVEALDRLGIADDNRIVVEKLSSPNHRVRATAAAVLLKHEAHEAAETVLDMLDAESQAHRISALWVVERMNLGSLIKKIEEMAHDDPEERVRRRADRVFKTILRLDNHMLTGAGRSR